MEVFRWPFRYLEWLLTLIGHIKAIFGLRAGLMIRQEGNRADM
jgi:hypothetical protein